MNSSKFVLNGAVALTFGLLTLPAMAQQVPITFTICQDELCGGGVNNLSYIGEAEDISYIGNSFGSYNGVAFDAGDSVNYVVSDTYDSFGFVSGTATIPTTPISMVNFSGYGSAFNGLTGARQTETYAKVPELPNNSIRWFDSFTNETGSTIAANIAFGGELGSDTLTHIHARGDGYLISGQGAPGGNSEDPVILHLYGNNDYAFNDVTVLAEDWDDNFSYIFPVTVAPGETVSIMNLNVLYGADGRDDDPSGTYYAQDVAEALSFAPAFINDPIFAGLTAQQVESLINWGDVVIDGTLPAAGTVSGMTNNMIGAFGGIFDAALAMGPAGFVLPENLASAPLGYSANGPAGSGSPGAVAIAQALGASGGAVNLHRTYQSEAFLFGGLTSGTESFSTGVLDFSGFSFGAAAETVVAPNLTLGAAAGYAAGSGAMPGVYSDIDSNHYIFSPYLHWENDGGTVVDARFTASLDDLGYARTAGVGTALASTSGNSLGARFGVSQALETEWATVTPYATLSYLRSFVEGYEETGAGAANVDVPSYSSDRLEAILGLGLSRDWSTSDGTTVSGYVRGGVGDNLLDADTIRTSYTTSPTTYLNVVENSSGLFGKLDLGLSADVADNLVLSAGYSGTFSRTSDKHTIVGRIGGRF